VTEGNFRRVENMNITTSAKRNEKSNKVCSIRPEFADGNVKGLVAAAKSGDSRAFAALCETYTQQLLRATRRVTRNREDAEDAVQDAMLSAFVHIGDFDGRSSFSTWLTRIAINSALMILRKRRTWHAIATEGEDDFVAGGAAYQIADHAPSPEHRYAQREEEGVLNKAIQRLRPNLRQIVMIQHLQERSIRETAEVVGITVAAAKARLFHAKVALRRSAALKLARRSRSTNIPALSAA
jgi:RNA polymerase sigma-70 factor (ECF subfamily)